MKRLWLAGLALSFCALPALAQNPPSPLPRASPAAPPATSAPPLTGGTTYSSNQTVTPPRSSMPDTAWSAALPGANSFTESQARGRLKDNGYSQVSNLTKGSDGIWRGTAMKNGGTVGVSVDYKGDISVN